jgi:hypothetical protein
LNDWRHNIIDRYVIPQIDFTASSLVDCLLDMASEWQRGGKKYKLKLCRYYFINKNI